jgi:hypothetical protein
MNIECITETFNALLTPTIAIIAAYIAWRQWITSHNQFKFGLYNRRFNVYDRTINFYSAYMDYNPDSEEPEKQEKLRKLEESKVEFIIAYRESRFLFGESSLVYVLLEKIKNNLLIRFQLKVSTNTDIYYCSQLHKDKESQPHPEEQIKSLENALLQWIDFSKL